MAELGLLRATMTLLAAGSAAQALPLLLAPLLTRLYAPQEFGVYHLFAAVAANIAVVACLRYEFALPMARDDAEAHTLRTLCLRLLLIMFVVTALVGCIWTLAVAALWPLWLPWVVLMLGAVSVATLQATRERRFRPMAFARVLQHGGGAAMQAVFGWLHAGVAGLIAGLALGTLAAVAVLRLPMSGSWRVSRERLFDVARAHRDFPLLNTPHAFLGALQDTVSIALVAALAGPAAAGAWGLCMRVLKAPATLVGGALAQALYPHLAAEARGATLAGRAAVARAMLVLALLALPFVLLLWWVAPPMFVWAFGERWADAGDLARALALYIGVHFVASPMGVVTMAWKAQAFALRLALVGQALFVVALAVGLALGGLTLGGWLVSAVMALYFGWYFLRLATWPVPAAVP
jgi:O-antigen/teichoic acid export membrane protein